MWTLAVLALVLAPPEKPDDSAKDLAALNGKWLIVSAEFEGMDSTAIYRKKTLIVIEDGKLHFTDGFVNSQPTKFKLNVRTKPRSIDLEDGKGKKVLQGIYDLDKESLKLCFC